MGAENVADPARLRRLAAMQHGVFSRAQALACGVGARTITRRTRAGTYERLHSGVYRIAGAPATWRQGLMAACLACGPGAAVSHRTAAALWGLARFAAGGIEVTARPARRSLEGCTLHWSTLKSSDRSVVDGIPVTSVARTLADLAGCVSRDRVEEALDDALHRRLVTFALIRKQLRGGRAGTKVLRQLVDARSGSHGVPESVFETRLIRVVRAAGLPTPSVQHRVGSFRVDLAYVGERLAIEADGFRWHSSRQQWDRDRARSAALQAMGWTVLHVTWPELHERPERVVDAVRRALIALGAQLPRAMPDRRHKRPRSGIAAARRPVSAP